MARRCIVLTALLAASLRAQSRGAELSIALRDPAGLAIPAATVEATHEATGSAVTAESDQAGVAHFFALPPGAYDIVAAHDGFATLRRRGIALRAVDRIHLDLTLEPGPVNETVEVTAEAPLLQNTSGTVDYGIESKRIQNLPLDGRNFVQLLALAPGVNLPSGSTLPRFNGSRPRTSEYLYDGVSVLQPEPGQVAFTPIVDAIEELRVETNSYSAEYGRSNGGVIIVNQRSGGNQLHGTLFEFFRNERLNARNLFATASSGLPAGKPRFRRNQYGFVLGGPLRRNRTFFFTDWQGTRLDTGAVRTSTVPSASQKEGEFATPIYDPASTVRTAAGHQRSSFPGNAIPLARMDPAAVASMGRFPDPASPAAANNYRRAGSNRTAQDQADLRLDHYVSATQRLFGRYSYVRDHSRPFTPLPDGSGDIRSGLLADTLTRADSLAAEHTWTVSARAVNQVRLGFTRRAVHRDAIPGAIYRIAGLQQLGPPANAIGDFETSVTQLVDHFSWLLGAHSVKLGADVRLERLNVLQPPLPNGQMDFTSIFTAGLDPSGAPLPGTGDSFASFLLGQVDRYQIDVQPEKLGPRATIAELFVQDDWRLSRRLSLNLGLRYTLNFPSTVEGNRGAVFNLETQQLDFLGEDGFPRAARNLDKTDFGPRLGLAWSWTDSLVLRSGYGLTWIEMAGITTPFTTPMFPFIQSLSEQTLDNITPAFVLARGPAVAPLPPGPDVGLGQGVFAVQRDNGSGYAQQWNLSVQKTFGSSWSIEAGYLGSKLTRLGVPDVNQNQLGVDQLALGAALLDPVPNPFYGRVPEGSSIGRLTVPRAQLLKPFPRFTTVSLYRNNIGHSTYHSLQARLERRFSRGLTLSVAYTYSRLIDDAGAVFNAAILSGPVAAFNAADSHNKRLEKDVSTGNIPHILAASVAYDLPGPARGWQIAAIGRLQAGSPLAVTQVTNFNAFAGFGIQRPNRIADPDLPAEQRTLERWFNPAAFQMAPQFSIGNSSRNPVTGPGYRALDVMAGRTFAVSERWRFELRAEAFNVSNTPPLGSPNTVLGAPGFGSITTAGDPRVFELVGKVHF